MDLNGLTLAELVLAARAVFIKMNGRPELDDVVTPPRITIREKIHQIALRLRLNGRINFYQLFTSSPSITEIIVTFLAMLELIKRRLVHVNQETLFGEIIIEDGGLTDENEEFELEFNE